jgi:GNAT superfamily N-acetyltransferase
MARLEIVPFSDEHLEAAALLLGERHARHREAEPLLPEIDDFRAEIEREWRTEGASGVVAMSRGDTLAYLVGRPLQLSFGQWLVVGIAGHAVSGDPDLVRDLYAAAAARWVDEGQTRHAVFVPASDAKLLDRWFRLSFGASAALAARETAPGRTVADGVVIRGGTPNDLEAAARLERTMTESMLPSPSFSTFEAVPDQELLDEWRGTWDESDTYRHFVAERDRHVVGHILLYRRPPDLRVPADSIDLAQASTEPSARGTGVGVALTTHVLAWAYEHGYPTMITDWRMTNLLASRFWPRRGFRETFLRLYRSIP